MPKYKTVVIDTLGEMVRLYFSKAIGKHAAIDPKTEEKSMRNVSHFQPATERCNIWLRRAEDLKKQGTQLVILCHEQVDKIYAKGGEITPKGQQPQEPVSIQGIPDLPGSTFPHEVLRKCDAILRVRKVNGKLTWISFEEPLGPTVSDAPWVAGCRFYAEKLNNGFLPPSYIEIEKLALAATAAKTIDNWNPPYIWLIYGRPRTQKTLSAALTFPKPMIYFDFDHGLHVLGSEEKIKNLGIEHVEYQVEDVNSYDPWVSRFATCFDQAGVSNAKP